jgi:DNA-binding SARP family transcriptional activator
VAAAERAAGAFRRLGSGVLEAWARGLLALGLAESAAPEAREAAMSAESLARAAGAPGVLVLAYRAIAISDPLRRAEFTELADAVTRETGFAGAPAARLDVAPDLAAAGQRHPPMAPPVNGKESIRAGLDVAASAARAPTFRLFEGFHVSVGDETIALDRIKPRARALLRLLTLHAGSAVHREVIGAALWPEADIGAAARSLQVAVSAIRGLFGDALGADGARLIAREGDAYRLAVPVDAIDVRRFDRLLAEGRAARRRGDSPGPALVGALKEYTGDLLPEDGPEEWVVASREHYRTLAVEAAREAAETALLEGDPRAASEACVVGLAIDRYHDPLWRLLIEARSQAGDLSAADRDRREYEAILTELGLPAQRAVTAS